MVGIKLNELRMKCLRTETTVELTLKNGSVCNCISIFPVAIFFFWTSKANIKHLIYLLYIEDRKRTKQLKY